MTVASREQIARSSIVSSATAFGKRVEPAGAPPRSFDGRCRFLGGSWSSPESHRGYRPSTQAHRGHVPAVCLGRRTGESIDRRHSRTGSSNDGRHVVCNGQSLFSKGRSMKPSYAPAASRVSLVVSLLAAACGNDSASNSNEPPSDRFFRAVYAGSAGDGSANVLLFNQAMADARGSTVVVPEHTNAVLVEVFSEAGSGALTGTWTSSGRFTAAGAITGLNPFLGGATRYEVSGEFSDTELSATLTEVDPTDPEFSSTSEIAGVDINDGRSTAFCGVYSGSSSGAWNFVVQDTGNVRGSYSDGPLSGQARGEQVNLDWSYPNNFFCSGGGGGTASGAVTGNQVLAGTWSGTACGDPYSGTWEGRPCESPSATFVDASGTSGGGSSTAATAGGRCDDPGSMGTCFAAGPCCYQSTLSVDWTP
jgi:hypothetical protein